MTDDREALAHQLGVPVDLLTDATLARIADDPMFLHHLQVCRDDPAMLELLLGAGVRERKTHSAGALVARATRALARWAASGFAQVSEETRQQRLRTCRGCEHLSLPPKGLRLAGAERNTCGLCGCDVVLKSRLATETCPDGRW